MRDRQADRRDRTHYHVAFSVAGPLVWNSLPPSLRLTDTEFRTQLRTYQDISSKRHLIALLTPFDSVMRRCSYIFYYVYRRTTNLRMIRYAMIRRC